MLTYECRRGRHNQSGLGGFFGGLNHTSLFANCLFCNAVSPGITEQWRVAILPYYHFILQRDITRQTACLFFNALLLVYVATRYCLFIFQGYHHQIAASSTRLEKSVGVVGGLMSVPWESREYPLEYKLRTFFDSLESLTIEMELEVLSLLALLVQ
jgi:hypothetical protein